MKKVPSIVVFTLLFINSYAQALFDLNNILTLKTNLCDSQTTYRFRISQCNRSLLDNSHIQIEYQKATKDNPFNKSIMSITTCYNNIFPLYNQYSRDFTANSALLTNIDYKYYKRLFSHQQIWIGIKVNIGAYISTHIKSESNNQLNGIVSFAIFGKRIGDELYLSANEPYNILIKNRYPWFDTFVSDSSRKYVFLTRFISGIDDLHSIFLRVNDNSEIQYVFGERLTEREYLTPDLAIYFLTGVSATFNRFSMKLTFHNGGFNESFLRAIEESLCLSYSLRNVSFDLEIRKQTYIDYNWSYAEFFTGVRYFFN